MDHWSMQDWDTLPYTNPHILSELGLLMQKLQQILRKNPKFSFW